MAGDKMFERSRWHNSIHGRVIAKVWQWTLVHHGRTSLWSGLVCDMCTSVRNELVTVRWRLEDYSLGVAFAMSFAFNTAATRRFGLITFDACPEKLVSKIGVDCESTLTAFTTC